MTVSQSTNSPQNYKDAARIRDEIIKYKELDPIMSREKTLDEAIKEERYEVCPHPECEVCRASRALIRIPEESAIE